MPNAKRSGASRKKAQKARSGASTSGAANGSGSTPSYSASPSFTFTNPSTAPSFPPSPSGSSSSKPQAPFNRNGKKTFTAPSESETDSASDEDDSEEEESDDEAFAEADETPAPVPDSSLSPEEKCALAAKEKEQGNTFFKAGDYPSATRLYSHAIELDPTEPSYLTNRAASYMGAKMYSKALSDCLLAAEIQKHSPNPKTLLRLARCQIALGLVQEAGRTLDSLLPLDSSKPVLNERAKVDRIRSHLTNIARDRERHEWNMVLIGIDAAAREVEETPREWRTWKVEALCGKKQWNEVNSMAADLLRANAQNPEALYYRALALFYQGNHPQAIAHAQAALRNDPDYSLARVLLKRVRSLDALKEEGNTAFKKGQWQDAIDKYSEAIGAAEDNVVFNTTLLSNRATAYQKSGDAAKALADCDSCLELDPTYFKAMRTRARVHLANEDFEAAVRDFKAAYEAAPSGSNDETALKREVKEAEVAFKKSKMKDHYKTLGIQSDATEDAIKKAYRRQSLIHHPDKGGSDEKFKEVGEAYAILSDPQRRRKFDAGIDESDPMSGMDDSFGGMGGFPGGGGHFHSSPFGGGGFGGGGGSFEDMFGGGGGYQRSSRGNPYGF